MRAIRQASRREAISHCYARMGPCFAPSFGPVLTKVPLGVRPGGFVRRCPSWLERLVRAQALFGTLLSSKKATKLEGLQYKCIFVSTYFPYRCRL